MRLLAPEVKAALDCRPRNPSQHASGADLGIRHAFLFCLSGYSCALVLVGIGLPPPMAEWGSMVRDNAALISNGDITPLIPAAAIALLTVSVNFVADWVLNESSGLSDGE
ncbi:MAG: hypothetical protein R3D70_23115 [Rhizobiaceae bacterium]